ncbi:universal stress protein [Halovivax gelatinilyticus]|uniref:universal stress protein n=1 Tax=Halovivax gelatinilyticus TaxID=2961597 RepID=UPI003CCDF065
MTAKPSRPDDRPSVLVPLEVLTGETLPEGVPELLANAHVVLLGYHVLPEQTPPGQARMQFEDRAQRKLGEFERALTDAGATVERKLVFTRSEQQTLDRISTEHRCHAVLVPNACEPPAHVLVAIRGTIGVDRIATVVGGLFAASNVTVTLYHGLVDAETVDDAKTFLDGVTDRLTKRGIDPNDLDQVIDDVDGGIDRIAEVAAEYDAVVMGESDPSVATFVFGMPSKQLATRFLGPILVVQRDKSE